MLTIIIDDPRTMLTASKHRMSPFIKPIISHNLVRNEEKFICSRDDANVYVSDSIESMHIRMLRKLIE
ncbi:hypothetical protein WI27_27165 [Burkholderia cepacia]|nr:hypothetical protein WI27_27165 [Burkholderia cepacia]